MRKNSYYLRALDNIRQRYAENIDIVKYKLDLLENEDWVIWVVFDVVDKLIGFKKEVLSEEEYMSLKLSIIDSIINEYKEIIANGEQQEFSRYVQQSLFDRDGGEENRDSA